MAKKQVAIYRVGDSPYLAFPPVLLDKGGNTIEFVNSTKDALRVKLPKDAGEECVTIEPGKKADVKTKTQKTVAAFQYTIEKGTCEEEQGDKTRFLRHLVSGSDPILILEN
jgi:hypothetical protein